MRAPAILYLAGMGLLLVGERIIGGESPWRTGLDGAGLLALAGALGLLFRARAQAAEDQRAAHGSALLWASVGVASLLVYAGTTDAAVGVLGLSEEGEHRYEVVMTSLFAILWLAGTLPFLAADRSIAACPVVVTPGRTRDATLAALATALAIAMVFPLNYLGTKHNKRWDLGYFRTASPGTATLATVENLTEPVRAVLFFPISSDVTQEVRTYFDQIAGGNLAVEYVDHALEPELAKELKVRDNGTVALVRGEGDDLQSETIKIGTDFDAAKRNLKKLDEKVQESLIKLTRGKRTAYVVVGHGEMYWKAGEPKERTLDAFKQGLSSLQYKVKELGLAQGLGQEVPEDADLVVLPAPTEPLLAEEIAAIDAYRRRGGALFIAAEPDGADLTPLLEPLGLKLGRTFLAGDQGIAPITRRTVDRWNIASNKFSTHESVTTLSRNSKTYFALTPKATWLEELERPDDAGKVTITLRSLSDVWNDDNNNLEFDAPAEQRKGWPLAAAVTGPAPDATGENREYRAVVFSDATWMSDLFLKEIPVQGNALMLRDAVLWLVQDESLAGTVNSEEDVKIQHSREGQGWMFYGTSFLVPLALLSGGLARVRLRRKRGGA